MSLDQLQIHNYKSLRSINLAPGPLTVLVGPNAGGKSNLADALEFVGDVYRSGLEFAVARHGGYENICYRHTRRSKSPIRLEVRASFDPSFDRAESLHTPKLGQIRVDGTLEFNHVLEFGTASQRIQEPFRIIRESIDLSVFAARDSGIKPLLRWAREGDTMIEAQTHELTRFLEKVRGWRVPPFLATALETFPPLAGTESISRLLPMFLYLDTELQTSGHWGREPTSETVHAIVILRPIPCGERPKNGTSKSLNATFTNGLLPGTMSRGLSLATRWALSALFACSS